MAGQGKMKGSLLAAIAAAMAMLAEEQAARAELPKVQAPPETSPWKVFWREEALRSRLHWQVKR